jgi:hypothetical protein
MASLNIPYLDKLINDPILHDPAWPAMPTKLPSDVPKFEVKSGEGFINSVDGYRLKISLMAVCRKM